MPCPSPGSARGIKGRMIDREADDGLDEGRDVGELVADTVDRALTVPRALHALLPLIL